MSSSYNRLVVESRRNVAADLESEETQPVAIVQSGCVAAIGLINTYSLSSDIIPFASRIKARILVEFEFFS